MHPKQKSKKSREARTSIRPIFLWDAVKLGCQKTFANGRQSPQAQSGQSAGHDARAEAAGDGKSEEAVWAASGLHRPPGSSAGRTKRPRGAWSSLGYVRSFALRAMRKTARLGATAALAAECRNQGCSGFLEGFKQARSQPKFSRPCPPVPSSGSTQPPSACWCCAAFACNCLLSRPPALAGVHSTPSATTARPAPAPACCGPCTPLEFRRTTGRNSAGPACQGTHLP